MKNNQLHHVAHGVAQSTDTHPLPQRLAQIYEVLKEVIIQYTPHAAAIEETFVNRNPKSTLKLGEARGVVMLRTRTNGMWRWLVCAKPNQKIGCWDGARH